MAGLEDIDTSGGFKSYVHDTFVTMITELVDVERQVMTNYKENPTIPFDYYGLLLREISTKIAYNKEVYKRLTNEELDFTNP